MAFTRLELLVIARPAPGFEGTGFVAAVAVVALVVPDCRYEHPVTARAANRTRERII
jgi:hypothetical protein